MKCKPILLCMAMQIMLGHLVHAQLRATTTAVRITPVRQMHASETNKVQVKPAELHYEKILLNINSPKNVEIAIEPRQGDYLLYHPTPGFSFYQAPLAQLSVLACVYNKGTSQVDLDKVTIEYKKGTQTIVKTVSLPSDKLKVDPNYAWCWQNGRPYHENGDVVFLEAPFPTEATLKFYFKDYSAPIAIKKYLKPATQALELPFETKDLKKDEFWSSYSMHGGGDQVFAYDLGVSGYYNNAWSDLLPGKDNSINENFRVWGKPIYAMADGYVLQSLNECPNNGGPVYAATDEEFEEKMTEQKENYWGDYASQGGGAGNHLLIRHGSLVALYAHMQKGTIRSKFLSKGATIKKGELIGYAGNSGNSSAPHLHIHVKTYKDDDTPGGEYYRPLIFSNGYVIGKDQYTKPNTNVAWTSLNKGGIPGLQGKASFIWPGDAHPYCAYPTNWGEVSKHGITEAAYQQEFDKIWTCGYYPAWVDGYDVAGKTYFNVIFKPANGKPWVARHNLTGTTYQQEFNKWTKAGYRLVNVDSYKRNGAINYSAVWLKDGGVNPVAYHGATLAWHEANFKKHADQGLVPVNVSCIDVNGATYVTAIWEKKNTAGFYARPAMTLAKYKEYFKDYSEKQGFKLVYLNAYTKAGVPMLSGVWYKNAQNYNAWWAKHYLTASGYQSEYSSHLSGGYSTRCVTGYAVGATARFEGIWAK